MALRLRFASILFGLATIIASAQAKAELRPGDIIVNEPTMGWMLFGGVVSILLGIMIWRQFPLSGVWAIGTLLGIKLFFVGLIMVTAGSTVRSVAKG